MDDHEFLKIITPEYMAEPETLFNQIIEHYIE